MAFREELIHRLLKWERVLEEKKARYKEAWEKMRTRDKVITGALVGFGVCQIVAGLAMMAAGS